MSRVLTLLFPSRLIPLVTSFIMVPYTESLKHIFFIKTSISYFCSQTLVNAEHPQKLHKNLQTVNCKYQAKKYQLYLTCLNNMKNQRAGVMI